ncbi:transcriptional repressor LexA [Candidatus Fermentibacteria bacterium]|nr:transcriptional repressor LexA [Candidatus Fermentibacteria bacterium]
MAEGLTERRRAILEFVRGYYSSHGYPPTVREIGQAVGLKSTRSVKDHLDRLVRDGYIERSDRSARALSLGKRAARASDAIPVVGRVAAGTPILAEQNITSHISIPGIGPRGSFFLEVRGDSMTGAGILDGDLVLVREQPFVEQGQIAVVMIGDEATVKRFYKRPGSRIELVPENPAHETRSFGPHDAGLKVVGKVVAVLRLMEKSLLRPVT